MENISKNRIFSCLIVTGLSILFFFVGLTSIPCLDGGCALMFVSIFLFFASLAVAGIIFYPMAQAFDAVTTDTELLAHWTYDSDWYTRIIDREYGEH